MQVVSKDMLEAVARKGPASSREELGGPGAQGHNVLNFPSRVREATGQRGTAGDRISTGQRNTTLTSLAGTIRRRGFGEEAMYAALAVYNREQCEPPLP